MTGTMPSIRELLKFVKTADAPNGTTKKADDPGGMDGPTAHITGKLDGQDGPLPSGETLKPKDTLLAEQSPATTPADAGSSAEPKLQLGNLGVTVYAADDSPDKPKTTVDDPGTSHAASTEKLASMSTAELTKMAAAKCDDVLADLTARIQKTAGAAPTALSTEKTAANAAAAGYVAAAAVQPTDTEKQAAAAQYFEDLTAYGLRLADRVSLRIKKAAVKLAAPPSPPEDAPPDPGMPPPAPPGMDPSGGAPPGMPPGMDMGGGPPMPPGPPMDPMAGGGGPPPGGGGPPGPDGSGAPGGGLDLNEIINALIESGFTPDDIEQALAQVAQQTQAAPPTEEMPPEAKAAALREIDNTRKLFKAAKAYQRSGKAQIVPAASAEARTRRNQIKKYAVDLAGLPQA